MLLIINKHICFEMCQVFTKNWASTINRWGIHVLLETWLPLPHSHFIYTFVLCSSVYCSIKIDLPNHCIIVTNFCLCPPLNSSHNQPKMKQFSCPLPHIYYSKQFNWKRIIVNIAINYLHNHCIIVTNFFLLFQHRIRPYLYMVFFILW